MAHHRLRHLGSRSRHEEDMRPDAVVVLVRMIGGAAFVTEWLQVGWSRMLVIALVRIVIIIMMMVVLDRTDRLVSGMIVVANVCRRSGATAHEVLSNERNEHHQ